MMATVMVGVGMAKADGTAIAAGKDAKAMAQTLFLAPTPMLHTDAVVVVVMAAGVTGAMDIVSQHQLLAMPISLLRRS